MVFKYDMHIKQDYEISNMILRMIIRQTSLLLLSILKNVKRCKK